MNPRSHVFPQSSLPTVTEPLEGLFCAVITEIVKRILQWTSVGKEASF